MSNPARQTISIRLNDNGPLGCAVRVKNPATGSWKSVNRIATDGHGSSFYCAWDNRDQAIRQARKYAVAQGWVNQ